MINKTMKWYNWIPVFGIFLSRYDIVDNLFLTILYSMYQAWWLGITLILAGYFLTY